MGDDGASFRVLGSDHERDGSDCCYFRFWVMGGFSWVFFFLGVRVIRSEWVKINRRKDEESNIK